MELHSHQSLPKWPCPGCTYLNWPKAVRCTQCDTPRENINILESSPSSSSELESRESLNNIFQGLSVSGWRSGEETQFLPLDMTENDMVSYRRTEGLSRAIDSLRSINPSYSGKNEEENGSGGLKWSCVLCTYDNWPKANKCVMCLSPRGNSGLVEPTRNQEILDEIPTQVTNNPPSPNNRNATARHNRFGRDLERRWLDACNGVVDGNIGLVESYLSAGGDPSRQLTLQEVGILNRPSAFEVGLTLIHLALRFQQENLLARLLSAVDGRPSVVKRVPSSLSPDLAREVRRHVMGSIRQRKGTLRCHVASEIGTFTLPREIDEYPLDVQERLFDEVLDRDVQKELEDAQVINWSPEILENLDSRLYALWNRSAGDCLLDSVLQATWGVFDQDNGLRQALSLSLQECASMFYERWKENELLQSHLLQFSLNEAQCAADWAKILSVASKPGSSLEQLHIFVLAHILRRPIIVYAVKFVKSFRGETLGPILYEGLYLPFFWERGFCYKSPICLGYTRGHFSALVTLEPDSNPLATRGRHAELLPSQLRAASVYLPLTSVDGNLLPIHFPRETELGKEEMVMSDWLDVRYTESGLLVAGQESITQPTVVAQMVQEWLNYYRPLCSLGSSSFLRRGIHPVGPMGPCYSSDGDSDD